MSDFADVKMGRTNSLCRVLANRAMRRCAPTVSVSV